MLRELRLPGSDTVLTTLPNFDLYFLGYVRKLCLFAREEEADVFDLEMAAIYNDGNRDCIISIVFTEVRMVKVPELMPSFHLAELEIEDIASEQMEGVRYRAKSYGTPRFEVLCKGIQISKC